MVQIDITNFKYKIIKTKTKCCFIMLLIQVLIIFNVKFFFF